MDLQTRKIAFVQEFLKLQSEEIISSLEKMLQKRKSELFEKNNKPMGLKQFNKEIDQALEDSENDRIIETMSLKSKIEKWI